MKLNAYVLAADPNFLAASIDSYYRCVDRIIVSYDRESTSWMGTPLPVAECLEIIRSVDLEGKCVLAPGDYRGDGHDAMGCETVQRREALAQASEQADWILQLDTDEVVAAPAVFFGAVAKAERYGAQALDFPSRWLYARAPRARGGPPRFLEASSRWWGPAAGFPGPLAVRAGTRLTLARQAADAVHFRIDFRSRSTDPWRSRSAVVHDVVALDHGVIHYSWVRSPEYMLKKFASYGHAAERTPAEYDTWVHRGQHPWSTVLTAPLRPRGDRFRFATVADPYTDAPNTLNATHRSDDRS